ncbi:MULTISPECIES: GNAT family N-acetyltransferase [Moraxella]|uniref:N-acetyltransferase n=1 Tax=Moraxella nasicaprae TaxID=2904122 RepID=A0ABY6F1X4_9GAMM|nr:MULTISPECIES: GNAT family N-acetyltransferase [Moraxella]MDO4895035.1 GNAT family N-acetyltransferase [Moraxella sp.]UXZ04089.1 N-acetyltransferase [Moraxella nasicaprae]
MHITHSPTTQRFETTIDGHTAYLSYEVLNEDTLNYNHTIVPSELGGRGIGSALVKFALEYAQQHHKKIVPSCSFVAAYIDKKTEYQQLLA